MDKKISLALFISSLGAGLVAYFAFKKKPNTIDYINKADLLIAELEKKISERPREKK